MRFRAHQEAAQRSTRRLLALFALVVVGLVIGVNLVLALIFWITVPFARGLPLYFFEVNTAMVLLFVLGGSYVESLRLAAGGPHVAALAGARLAQTSGNDEAAMRERRFANVIQEMALASGLRPPPQAWVMPRDDAINAFAAGWTPDDAVVVVTRGTLERLTRAELTGVVAHEFGHLLHGDTRLNMRLVGLVWGLQMVWGLGQRLWSEDEHGRRGAGALFGLGLLAVGSLGWLAGRWLQAAVSRQREFHADATAVKFARDVDGLGGALRKIADQQARRVQGLSSAHEASLAHLLLAGRTGNRRRWRSWLATHPSLSARLSRLYGRHWPDSELPLPAERQSVEIEAEGVARIAPVLPPQGAAPARSGELPAAHLHDATQVPAFHDHAEREREALSRIEHWHGPGEWQAAMLALAIDRHSPGLAAHQRVYQQATNDLPMAEAVLKEVAALGTAARHRVFAQLLQRAADAPAGVRRRLWREWHSRWRALHAAHGDAGHGTWRATVVRHGLGPASTIAYRGSLATEAETVAAATAMMADCLGLKEERRRAWRQAATAALQAAGMPAPRGLAAGRAPLQPTPSALVALRVRKLSTMQRPLIVRAWVEAASVCGALDQDNVADALHLACIALDVPVPSALQQPRSGATATQPRSA